MDYFKAEFMKSLLIPCFLLFTMLGYSQINRGAVFLGGDFILSSSASETDDTDFYLDPKSLYLNVQSTAGYFLSEKWLVGGGLGYSFRSFYTNNYYYFDGGYVRSRQRSKDNLYSVSVFAARYIPIKGNLFFNATLEISAGFGNGKEGDSNDNFKRSYDRHVIGASISPGLTYFISSRWAAVANIGRLSVNYTDTNGSDGYPDSYTTTFSGSLKPNTFSIGVQYYLNNGSQE